MSQTNMRLLNITCRYFYHRHACRKSAISNNMQYLNKCGKVSFNILMMCRGFPITTELTDHVMPTRIRCARLFHSCSFFKKIKKSRKMDSRSIIPHTNSNTKRNVLMKRFHLSGHTVWVSLAEENELPSHNTNSTIRMYSLRAF